jgi:SM-20-related protein
MDIQHGGAFSKAAQLADQLYSRGYGAIDHFISPALVEALATEARQLWDEGSFEYARIGTGAEKQRCPSVRSDRILWLDPAQMTPAQKQYMDALEELRVEINRRTMLGLFEWEGHLAMYPPQTFYRRHLDVFRHARERKVSVILYLNDDWSPVDGGELRIYTEGTSLESYVDVAPRAGTLATFLSEEFYHEVLLAHAERLSITGWFRVRS